MIYFYGTREEAKGIDVDAFATTIFKDALPKATLVYTNDEEIKKVYTDKKVDVKSIAISKTAKELLVEEALKLDIETEGLTIEQLKQAIVEAKK